MNNKTITIPDNSVLEFQGGSFKNGTITGNNTIISNTNYYIFNNVKLSGSFLGTVRPEWFGAIGNGTNDDTNAFQAIINSGFNYIELTPNKNYAITSIKYDSTYGTFNIIGNHSTITCISKVECNAIEINASNVTIKDLELVGPGQHTEYSTTGLNIYTGDVGGLYLNIDNVNIRYFSNKGLSAVDLIHSKIDYVKAQYCQTGLWFAVKGWDASTTTTISNIYCGGCTYGISMIMCYYFQLNRICCEWNQYGMYAFAGNISFNDLYFEMNTEYGLMTEDCIYVMSGDIKKHSDGDAIIDAMKNSDTIYTSKTKINSYNVHTKSITLVSPWANKNMNLSLSMEQGTDTYMGVALAQGLAVITNSGPKYANTWTTIFNANGDALDGGGMSCSKQGTGSYLVRFPKSCQYPAIFANSYNGATAYISKWESYAGEYNSWGCMSGCFITFCNTSGAAIDTDFAVTLYANLNKA